LFVWTYDVCVAVVVGVWVVFSCVWICCCLQVKMNFTSAEELLSDSTLLETIRTWCSKARSENMGVERLLAQIRKGVGGSKAPTAERVMTAGFMTQWLGEHFTCGGEDIDTIVI